MRILAAVIVVVIAGLGALYFRYGTLSPCGMARQSFRDRAAADHDKLGAVVSSAMPDAMVNGLLAAQYGELTPTRCIGILFDNGPAKR